MPHPEVCAFEAQEMVAGLRAAWRSQRPLFSPFILLSRLLREWSFVVHGIKPRFLFFLLYLSVTFGSPGRHLGV